ncbi:hypothetical protein KC19_11G036400 [Ceratodon purpureus]|uniref:RING-type domain-containing protein n=1 Tax=Ceratodon purpureus TaxID=3225 RepID=A0A8T0GBX0_CERPU|nr:hypothetical protein KC19_11G036400 [Ceratodon purpureus]KAG0556226.1 hypothetical protein KC19_11G036400 [Ceratodon purpureus]
MEGSKTVPKSLSEDPLFIKFSKILPCHGAIVDEIREEIPESVVSSYFGPKASKSGWKYARHSKPEEAAAIFDLWTKVYDDGHMPNKEISLQFARGLILQQTQPVNWAEFAVRRQRYRERQRESKKTGIVKVEKSIVNLGGVQVLGKKRFQVPSHPVEAPLPSALKLTLKEELEEDFTMGKRVGPAKGKGFKKTDDGAPRWEASELQAMSVVIERTESLLEGCRVELKESSVEVERLEGQSRRAAFNLSDRVVMLEDHEREVAGFLEKHTRLQSTIQETESLLSIQGGSEVLNSALVSSKLQVEDVALSMALASKASAHCRAIVLGCRVDLASVEEQLRESLERHENVRSRLSGLERLLVSMRDQSKKMNEGTGYAFFPRPIANNPESPLSTVHILNACPVCGYWYLANNFVPLSCGHTYHVFCLAQHARTSSLCCFQGCDQEFSSDSICSIGIRISQPITNLPSEVKIEGAKAGQGREFKIHETRLELRGPEIPRPALVFGCVTPSTSVSTAQDSEPSSESFKRREENTTHTSTTTRSAQPEHVTNLGGSDSSGARSFSELERAPQAGFNQSQSSVSNDISGKTHAADGTTGKLCTLCKTKAPTSVSLTACGHDNFCFKCISGLVNCPICTTKIGGWVVTSHKSNPSLFPPAEAVGDHTDANESSDDEDNPVGVVEWCDDDLFSQGGVRTVLGSTVANESVRLEGGENSGEKERPSLENDEVAVAETPERTEDRAPSPKKTFIRRATRTMATEEPGVADVELESSRPIIALSKKRRGRRSLDVDTLNHTRLMERPLTEILIAAPLADLDSKGNEKDDQPTSNCIVKRPRTGATRGNSQRLTVPAKFRE